MLLPDVPVERAAVLGTVLAVATDGTWRPLPPRPAVPRREAALSFVVLAASAVLLEIHPRLACSFLGKLGAAERRYAWTSALLY